MSNSSLDLSKFPKIVPQSREALQEEVSQRSLGLQTIRSIMENLVNAMQSYYQDLKDLDGKAGMLEKLQENISDMEKQVRMEGQELERKKRDFDEHAGYIKQQNKELKEKELNIMEEKLFNEKSNQQQKEELEKREKEIKGKLLLLADLDTKATELQDKEKVLQEKVKVDTERKYLLDKREENILVRESRLARLEQDAKIG